MNSLGEVPDSAWYENRLDWLSPEEAARGPNRGKAPCGAGPWLVIQRKREGGSAGFWIQDSCGRRYLLKFDPLHNPEMATAAEIIGGRLFYALGYFVPENYLIHFERKQLSVGSVTGNGATLSERDIDEILANVPRTPDGKYRAVASLYVPGKILGPFQFFGARHDDVNDSVRHEHRRDLRGLFVFCAWLNHDDIRVANTLDSLVDDNGLRYVRHYLIDFGSALGSQTDRPNTLRAGYDTAFAWRRVAFRLLSFGRYTPYWKSISYPDLPSVGRFEWREFEPEKFRPQVMNAAFHNRLPDDTFWAAKQVMRLSNEHIRAVVRAGKYSDPTAEEWVIRTLIERRNKIGRAYFEKVLPLDNFRVEDGWLKFEDLGVIYGFAAPRRYRVQWAAFDNEAGRSVPLANAGGSCRIPNRMRLARAGAYYQARITSADPAKSVIVYLRKTPDGFQTVGIDRLG